MISVIVPVYNVENYLKRCIDSILTQTFQDFEIILVDDGSKDKSPEICDNYAKKYNNIKVIHQKNQGLSEARNIGTNSATNDYITYIDSDDLVHPKYLEILVKLCQKYDADLSCCNSTIFYDDNNLSFSIYEDTTDFCLPGINAMQDILYGKFHGTSACGLLIKTQLAKKFKFEKGKYHEDDLLTFKYFYSSKTVGITTLPLYYYFQREGSIMHQAFGKTSLDELDAADYILSFSKTINKKSIKASYNKMFSNYTDVLFSYSNLNKIDKSSYKRIKTVLKQISKHMIFDKKIGKRTRLSVLIVLIFGVNALSFFHNHFRL